MAIVVVQRLYRSKKVWLPLSVSELQVSRHLGTDCIVRTCTTAAVPPEKTSSSWWIQECDQSCCWFQKGKLIPIFSHLGCKQCHWVRLVLWRCMLQISEFPWEGHSQGRSSLQGHKGLEIWRPPEKSKYFWPKIIFWINLKLRMILNIFNCAVDFLV